jgi:quercetin dioxygenase-like cupin family protein
MEVRDASDWVTVDRPGAHGVEARILRRGPGLLAVMLRFAPGATIDPHAAPHNIDVVCVSGQGFVSVGDETAPFVEGNSIHWPAGVTHRLWTEGAGMLTLMLEHVGPGAGL